MAGNTGHGDVSRFFPDAGSAECRGGGSIRSVVVTRSDQYGSYPTSAECPLCVKERLAASILHFIPPRFRAPVEIPVAVTEWAGRGKKAQGLYLAGQVGTGKTHTAWMAVAAWCQAAGIRPHGEEPATVDWATARTAPNVIFTRLTDLLDDLRPGEVAVRTIRDCQHANLLAIDDIGAEKPSEWTQERVYSVIDHRYANCLPLIVTSNLPPSKLADQIGERAASRLAEMCEVVTMTGADRRKPSA